MSWKHGPLGCCDGGPVAFFTKCLCGPCVMGRAFEVGFEENCVLYGIGSYCCAPCASFLIRSKSSEKYNIEEGIVMTALCAICCGCCSNYQVLQEIEDQEGGKFGCIGAWEK